MPPLLLLAVALIAAGATSPLSNDVPNRTIALQFEDPDPHVTTIFTSRHMQLIALFEQQAVNASNYWAYCLRNSSAQMCDAVDSVVPIAAPNGTVLPADLLQALLAQPQWRPHVGWAFPAMQSKVRSFLHFGAPLMAYASPDDRAAQQQEEFEEWFNTTLDPWLNTLVAEFAPQLKVTLLGEPFQYYEGLWALYKERFQLNWTNTSDDASRFLLFKANAKRVEYLTSLKVNATLAANLNPFMHLTHNEFLRAVHDPLPGSAPLPLSHAAFLMWTVVPNFIDPFPP
eukprot:GGOE01003131.1.p1 GENE.GGOE01003131.1~~GGOE01003131.1.p1  ORF type:complete len:285 (-),score=90.87 GGOE01003131.1:198-1052(-)